MRTIHAQFFQILNDLFVKKTYRFSFVLFFFWLSFSEVSLGQTPGMVIKPTFTPGNAVLDPDGDGYVSQKTKGVQLGCATLPTNYITHSEILYAAIICPDPLCDIIRGHVGAFIKIGGINAAGNNAILTFSNGTNRLICFRLGGYAPNSSSYSIMIDRDGKFGFARPKANPKTVTGIPGFQAESVTEINLNVSTYNVKGIVCLFAQLCAQGAQLTPLFIPLYKVGRSIFYFCNLSFRYLNS